MCIAKKISKAVFIPRVLIYQTREIWLPMGYKTARPKTGDWGWLWPNFSTSSFAKKNPDFSVIFLLWANQFAKKWYKSTLFIRKLTKMSEKCVFREAWSPEMTSHSFPVSCFLSRAFVPPEREVSRFRYIKTRGREIAIEVFWFFLLYLSVHWGDFIGQIKQKKSVMCALNGKVTLNWAEHCNY